MLEKLAQLLIKLYEHIGDEAADIDRMNDQRVLYTYCIAQAIDEVVGGFVCVAYCQGSTKVNGIFVISGNDLYVVDPFYTTNLQIYKADSLEKELFMISSPRLVQVSGRRITFKELVYEGLEDGKKAPTISTINKFLKLKNDLVNTLSLGDK